MVENLTILRPDSFLSAIVPHYKFYFASLPNPHSTDILHDMLTIQSNPKSAHITIKTRADDKVSNQLLHDCSFQYIETNVLFSTPLSKLRLILPYYFHNRFWKMDDVTYHDVTKNDEDTVSELASRSFTYDRFHTDPHLAGYADTIKREWVRNYYQGKRGNYMIVADCESKTVGFLLLIIKDNVAIIDLIATDTIMRKKHIGKTMIAYSLSILDENIVSYQAGTQVANAASVAFYQSLGFKILSASNTYHYLHLPER